MSIVANEGLWRPSEGYRGFWVSTFLRERTTKREIEREEGEKWMEGKVARRPSEGC